MSTDRWMDKEVVVCIHSGILAIKRNTYNSVLMEWMNLEPIIHSEVSQKEKDKYRIQFSSVQSLSHVQLFATPWTAARQASLSITNSWSLLKLMSIESVMPSNTYIWNLKRWYWWTYLQGSKEDTDIEKRLVDTVGEGEGGTNWESRTETYTLSYAKLDTSGNLLSDAGSSNLELCDNLEGWDRVGDRREGQEGGDIHNTYGWFMLMYGRNQHNIVEQVSPNLK